jgi:hypothetical protein
MKRGNSARRFVSLGVALIALVALTVSLGTGAASAGPGHAVTAKKKCKKAKKGAVSAKKKKCKRHKTVVPPATTPPVTQPAVPTTRASITWDTSDEVDMHVFDAAGNHAFYDDSFGIPDADEEDQSTAGGPETFVDNLSPSTRTFTVYLCLYSYENGMQTSGPVHVTADITDPGGAHRSIPVTLDGVGNDALVTVSPGTGTQYVATGFCGTM